MFSRFSKKSVGEHEQLLDQLLELDNNAFVEAVSGMIANQHGAAGAMCLVALENIRPMLFAFRERNRKEPQANLPESLEDNLRMVAKGLDDKDIDEINERRRYWFFYSLLILRATRICENERQNSKAIAKLWCALVQGGQHLSASLEHNLLWSDLEKEWFAPVNTEKDGMKYVLNQMLPKWLQGNEDIKRLAELGDIRSVAGRFL